MWGIGDDQIQTRLLGEAKLTYEKAMQLSQSMETATKNRRRLTLKSPRVDWTMHKVISGRPLKPPHHSKQAIGVARQDTMLGCVGVRILLVIAVVKGHLRSVCLSRKKEQKWENLEENLVM